jgi:hypothetical protein
MPKANVRDLFRVVNTLEDGRKLYLSTQGKLLVMPRAEAEFWAGVARQVQGVTIDEMVYSKDLRYYERRSFFLERLMPFSRVVKTSLAVSRRPRSISSFARATITATQFWSFADLAARHWAHAAPVRAATRSVRTLCKDLGSPVVHVCAMGLVTVAATACECGW